EVSGVHIYVESKPVHGHPPAAADSQCADLACPGGLVRIKPDACQSLNTSRVHPVLVQCLNDRIFERAQVAVNIREEMIQSENGVTHNLARSVVGDIASPVNFVKGSVYLFQRLLVEQ